MALRFLAAAVAYSRVHTGVHYPGDAVVGSLLGAGIGQAVAGSIDRLLPTWLTSPVTMSTGRTNAEVGGCGSELVAPSGA